MQIAAPKFGKEEITKVQECLNSGWVTQGPFVKEFETLFAQHHQVKHALACTSCTSALHLATMALGLGPEDEAIVPAFTWVTSANCVEYTGAKAVFVDVDPNTFNIDPNLVEAAITPRTKAIIVVHLFGLAAPMDELNAIAKKHNLAIVEDAACATGSYYNGTPIGTHGNMACFSFHPRKVITTGEGGIVTTCDDNLASQLNSLRNHGATGIAPDTNKIGPYTMGTFNMLGYNYRLSDIQAAVGVVQMARLDALLKHRIDCANHYRELLQDVEEIILPFVPENCGHSYQSFVIRLRSGNTEKRNHIMDVMSEADIQTRPGTHAVHRLGYYTQKYNLKAEAFPNAMLCEDSTITLPIFPNMTKEEQKFVVEKLKSSFIQCTNLHQTV